MIYYTFGTPEVHSEKSGAGSFFKSLRMKYRLEEDDLVTYFDDNNSVASRWVNLDERWLGVCILNKGLEFSDAKQGNIYLVDEDNNPISMEPEIVFLLRYALPQHMLTPYVVGNISDYKEMFEDSLILANVKSNEFICRDGDMHLQKLILLSDGIYGYHLGDQALRKFNFELDDAWSFDPGAARLAPMQAIPHKDRILYYHGFARSEVLEEVPIPGEENLVYKRAVRRDGELYCLDRETGKKFWERTFTYGLNDMVLHQNKLYCIAENELFRLAPETGKIEHQVEMEYSAGGDTELSNVLTVIENKLWIQINHWFYKTHCLLVVDLDTFAIEHKIDIPAPYQPEKFLYYDEQKRQVYYRLHFRHAEIRVEHNHPLLVLSLDELDQPLTFEPRPEIDISFKPSADDKDLEELWVHIKDTPLHKAIRFGIIETQNQTNIHAEMNRHGEGCRKTFNGRVHFRYSGSDKPKEEVEEQLKVIEDSFNEWAQIMRVEAGTGSGEPVSIDVEYIE